MGRLTLNVLLSFAQFEREVTGERIRDKIAASKRKGMWMGGVPALGYDVRDRRLVVNRAEATTVKHVYERYLELGSVRLLRNDLEHRKIVSKVRVSKNGMRSGGRQFSRLPAILLVRTPAAKAELQRRGIEHVVVNQEGFLSELADLAARLGATAIFDGVGGELVTGIAPILPMNSTIYFCRGARAYRELVTANEKVGNNLDHGILINYRGVPASPAGQRGDRDAELLRSAQGLSFVRAQPLSSISANYFLTFVFLVRADDP
jgi:hypothetical protein